MLKQEETRAQAAQKNEEINKFLESSEAYLYKMAWQLVPQNSIARDDLDLIVNDIVQNTEIKFWLAARKWEIAHPHTYIQTILRHEVVNVARKRMILPLPLYLDNELTQEAVLIASGEESDDPLYELVQQETAYELLEEVAKTTSTFPRRQKWAFISSLKERVDDRTGLIDALSRHNLDASEFPPPTEDELPTHRSSLSIARKKLRIKLNKFLDRIS
jgi:DNA-directed RNA polymerase specialized sigma24 family protein